MRTAAAWQAERVLKSLSQRNRLLSLSREIWPPLSEIVWFQIQPLYRLEVHTRWNDSSLANNAMNSSRLQPISLARVAKVFQKLPSEATGFALNYATVTHGASVGVRNLIHGPHLAYAVVNTSESILGAKIGEARKLALYLGLGEFSNDAEVHDEEPLFICVRRSRKPRDTLR
jgi:hypothetical protein